MSAICLPVSDTWHTWGIWTGVSAWGQNTGGIKGIPFSSVTSSIIRSWHLLRRDSTCFLGFGQSSSTCSTLFTSHITHFIDRALLIADMSIRITDMSIIEQLGPWFSSPPQNNWLPIWALLQSKMDVFQTTFRSLFSLVVDRYFSPYMTHHQLYVSLSSYNFGFFSVSPGVKPWLPGVCTNSSRDCCGAPWSLNSRPAWYSWKV